MAVFFPFKVDLSDRRLDHRKEFEAITGHANAVAYELPDAVIKRLQVR